MRLVTFEFQGRNRLGAEQDGQVVDLNRGYALLLATRGVVDFQGQADRELPADMRGFLDRWDQSAVQGKGGARLRPGDPGKRGASWPGDRAAAPGRAACGRPS